MKQDQDIINLAGNSFPPDILEELLKARNTYRANLPSDDLTADQRFDIWRIEVTESLKSMARSGVFKDKPGYAMIVESEGGPIDVFVVDQYKRDLPCPEKTFSEWVGNEALAVSLGMYVARLEYEVTKGMAPTDWYPWKSLAAIFVCPAKGEPVSFETRRIFNSEMPWTKAAAEAGLSPGEALANSALREAMKMYSLRSKVLANVKERSAEPA